MAIEYNQAIVRELFTALNRGYQALTAARPAIFAHDEISYFAGQRLDYEAHAQFDAMVFAAFPDIQFTLDAVLADQDHAVARFTVRGTQTGVFQGIPATDQPVRVSGLAIYRVAGGRVVEQWLEYDQLGMLQQLGVIPAPAALEA